MKKQIIFLLSLVLLGCMQQDKGDQSDRVDKPNILIFLVDDLGKEWVSCYGAEGINTPNIDALAESGMLFHNAYSMPQCTPTRLTFLTGQYPFRHGWVNHWDVPRWGGGAHFDETLNPSIGIEMKKAGYKTCIAGKWQIDDFRVEPDALVNNGFDEFCMWTGYETGIEASAERYQNPYLFTREGSKTYEGKFGPDVFRDFIINFIQKNKAAPLFIYFPMVLTHTPLVNTPDETADDPLGKHKAMVRYTDKITGEIVQALENEGKRDNTIIIWTTDNGSTRGIEGLYKGRSIKGAKARTTEAGICAPFIVSWPDKVKSNQQTDALIDFSDFYPTCLDLAGIEVKEKDASGNKTFTIDGKSFKDVLINNSQTSNRDWILGMGGGNHARLTENGVENQYVFRDRVLRNKRYKLYINTKREAEQFYDLQEDPFEEVDLIDRLDGPERSQNFEQLMEVAKSFPEKDSDPRYHPNPTQVWDVAISAQSLVWKNPF